MNILAIGAHFDDVELGCGGSLAKHRANGDNVTIQVITHSKYQNHDGTLVREKKVAYQEGKRAAEILGCKMLCNNYETKKVKFSHKLIEDINRVVDRRKIDLIYSASASR